MNITFTTIKQATTGEWLFTWASTGAAYYRIVLHGHEIANTVGTSYTFNLPISSNINTPPPIEVVAERDLAVSEFNLPYMILQWYGVANAVSYRLYELVDASWVLKDTFANQQQFLYTFTTSILADETDAKFRVVAVNEVGMESSPLAFAYKVVRPPHPVATAYTYNAASGTMSISAA